MKFLLSPLNIYLYEYQFEGNFQTKFSPSNKRIEQPEEELIELKGEQQMEPNTFSSEPIRN